MDPARVSIASVSSALGTEHLRRLDMQDLAEMLLQAVREAKPKTAEGLLKALRVVPRRDDIINVYNVSREVGRVSYSIPKGSRLIDLIQDADAYLSEAHGGPSSTVRRGLGGMASERAEISSRLTVVLEKLSTFRTSSPRPHVASIGELVAADLACAVCERGDSFITENTRVWTTSGTVKQFGPMNGLMAVAGVMDSADYVAVAHRERR